MSPPLRDGRRRRESGTLAAVESSPFPVSADWWLTIAAEATVVITDEARRAPCHCDPCIGPGALCRVVYILCFPNLTSSPHLTSSVLTSFCFLPSYPLHYTIHLYPVYQHSPLTMNPPAAVTGSQLWHMQQEVLHIWEEYLKKFAGRTADGATSDNHAALVRAGYANWISDLATGRILDPSEA